MTNYKEILRLYSLGINNSRIAETLRLFGIPILIFNPAQIVVISETSSTSSAIIGDAPQATKNRCTKYRTSQSS